MKHLLLAALLCFCGIFHSYAADDGIILTFDDDLGVTINDGKKGDELDPPIALPPTRPRVYSISTAQTPSISSILAATTVQILVYDSQGSLIYQSIESVSPNSNVSIETTNWLKGKYTLVVCFPQGEEKATEFTL